jgi:hypothetical protein
MVMKNIIAGMGEIGNPILKLISKKEIAIGFDIDPKLTEYKKLKKYEKLKTSFLHICIPYSKNFLKNIHSLYNKFKPSSIIIHSTIEPYTTEKIQKLIPIPIIYSATRGVHKRMIHDLKRYTKFYAIEKDAPQAEWAAKEYAKLMKKCGVKTKKMSNPLTLELAKIVVDTSYYGWLINYAQITNMIAKKHGVNYDEMWSFSDEIHKFLGNRPKMYPGFIGGHCVIPNLDLMNDKTLNIIREINSDYAKILKKRYK